jgi:hypothetical protein
MASHGRRVRVNIEFPSNFFKNAEGGFSQNMGTTGRTIPLNFAAFSLSLVLCNGQFNHSFV